MSDKKYKITFIKAAQNDYRKLDGSVRKLVNVALSKLEIRADKLGERLTNKHGSHLAGCRRIKLRQAGIRIVYRIDGLNVDIVEVIAIGKRENFEVYKQASKRLD